MREETRVLKDGREITLRERKRIKEGTPKRKRPTKEKKQVNENLIEVAIKARQAGMTYGQYVAMCYAKGIKV